MKGKVYKSVLKVEILSEDPYPEVMTLNQVAFDIVEGECSGVIEWESLNAELHGEEAVKECDKHGSDPEFFQIDENGNKIEE